MDKDSVIVITEAGEMEEVNTSGVKLPKDIVSVGLRYAKSGNGNGGSNYSNLRNGQVYR